MILVLVVADAVPVPSLGGSTATNFLSTTPTLGVYSLLSVSLVALYSSTSGGGIVPSLHFARCLLIRTLLGPDMSEFALHGRFA